MSHPSFRSPELPAATVIAAARARRHRTETEPQQYRVVESGMILTDLGQPYWSAGRLARTAEALGASADEAARLVGELMQQFHEAERRAALREPPPGSSTEKVTAC